MGCAGYFCAWATSVTRNTATQSSSRRLSLGMEVLPPSARVAVLNSRHARSRRTPDRVCRLQDALKLSPLLILGERDFRHPTEAALRTDCELINREVLARLVNSALEQVERFEIGCLCRDKPEDRDLAFRHVPKRLKAAGPLVIVFKQEPTMIDSLKYPLGYRVVVAFAMPLRHDLSGLRVDGPRIPTAQMNSEGNASEPVNDRVVRRDGTRQVFVRMFATASHPLERHAIDVCGVPWGIDRDVSASCLDQPSDHVARDRDDIGQEFVHALVDIARVLEIETLGDAVRAENCLPDWLRRNALAE